MRAKKNLLLIFTRDFDQWVQEILRNVLVKDCQKVWGRGLSDQIVCFTGRTFEWYRYEDDMLHLRDFLVHKKLNDKIFSASSQREFIRLVSELRQLMSISPKKIKNQMEHLERINHLFRAMYPYYPLGIFIPGPWREEFLQIHGQRGMVVMERLINSREKSEGLLKEVGNYLRQWFEPIFEGYGYPKNYFRLLSVKEVKILLGTGRLPSRKFLLRRARGYVYFKNKILLESDFSKFLKGHRLKIVNQNDIKNLKEVKGTVAYAGNLQKGTVQIIMNSYEVSTFHKGSILVTTMTSPEYLAAMRKSKAIITDEGGITCHAAIVAREIKVPTLIGTKIATKVLRDGQLVEVDTSKGVVHILKK